MFIQKNNSKIATIVLVLSLIIAASVIALPSIEAQDIDTVRTTSSIAIVPSPIGVDQTVYVNLIIQPLPPSGEEVFHGLELEIVRPDGEIETLGPYTSVFTGTISLSYTPSQVGTYEFQMTYPGEFFEAAQFFGRDLTYEPSQSPVTELEVQQEKIPDWPGAPLPTEYWTRPISGELREWSSISGNWLMHGYNATYPSWVGAGAYNPYSQAVRAPHIMWTKELALGGIVGGDYVSSSYYPGLSYEDKMTPIIMNGILYYNLRLGSSSFKGFVAVDLRTGQELWRNMDTTIKVGQLFNFVSPNQMGVIPYLWGDNTEGSVTTSATISGTYNVHDAFTGQLLTSFGNASSGPIVFGPSGELLVYVLNSQNGWLAMWNSTRAFEQQDPPMIQPYREALTPLWRPRAGTYDWLKGIQWNVTNPVVSMTIGNDVYYPAIIGITGDVLLAFGGETGFPGQILHVGYSAKNGSLLWSIERPWDEHWYEGWALSFGEGIYTQFDPRDRVYVAYDATTGEEKWISDPLNYPWGMYTTRHMSLIANGKVFAGNYDGVHAFDAETGNELWEFFSANSGTETPYSRWPFFHGLILADGVLYAANGEHSPTQPLIRGERLFAIDAESGNELWNITAFSPLMAIADGYLLTYDAYDNRIYAYGKGPSDTTVEASPEVSVKGSGVLIKGMVTDLAAGTMQPAQAARFPDGVPAIADKDMGPWMEYVYLQKQYPVDVVGVPVILDAVDSDGGITNIGTVTSDSSGMFKAMWIPPDEGEYTIIATFTGSDSYWPSHAETAIGVGPAPSSGGGIEPETQAPFMTTEVAILVTVVIIAVIAVVGYWLIRKRK